jgi:hypothetical protein
MKIIESERISHRRQETGAVREKRREEQEQCMWSWEAHTQKRYYPQNRYCPHNRHHSMSPVVIACSIVDDVGFRRNDGFGYRLSLGRDHGHGFCFWLTSAPSVLCRIPGKVVRNVLGTYTWPLGLREADTQNRHYTQIRRCPFEARMYGFGRYGWFWD